MSLTRTGYFTSDVSTIKKELTVRATVNSEFGFPPPAFKVFKKGKNGICVPRYYGEQKLGKALEDKRPEPKKMNIKFNRNKVIRFRAICTQVSSFPRRKHDILVQTAFQ